MPSHQRRIILGATLLTIAAAMGFALRQTANVDVLYRTLTWEIGTGDGDLWLGEPFAGRGSDDDWKPGWRIRHTDAFPGGIPRTATPWRWWHWSWRQEIPRQTLPPSIARQSTIPIWIFPATIALPGLYLLFTGLNTHGRAQAGTCRKCGYSGKGLPSASPCPECGRRQA